MFRKIERKLDKQRNYYHSPRIKIVVSLVDRFRHFLHSCRIVLLINRYQLLSELIKKFDVMFVLVQLGVKRLWRKERERNREIEEGGPAGEKRKLI